MWKKQCGEEGKIDEKAFLQIYGEIDELFEDEEDNLDKSTASQVTKPDSDKPAVSVVQEEKESEAESADEEEEEESLDTVFARLIGEDGTLSKQGLRKWDEVSRLISENLVGEDEFDSIWSKTTKSDKMDLDGFLRFNAMLDELFEFEDVDEEKEEIIVPPPPKPLTRGRTMVLEEGLPPGVIFASIANEDLAVEMDDLQFWGELQDMLSEGDLLQKELDGIFAANAKDGKLNEDSFTKLYETIDALFVDDDVDGEEEATKEPEESPSSDSAPPENEAKEALEEFLEELNDDDERLPCGLECTDREIQIVDNIVSALESNPTNRVVVKQGNLEPSDLVGEWELLYTSSSALKFNQGLSGLGGSVPNGKFGGVRQILKYTKWVSDVDHFEKIVVTPASASFDVQITGVWDIRKSTSLFTGEPCTSLSIEPDRVKYGPTSTRADHWKSIGPTKMLDITYLDDNLRVMRGNTAT